MAAALKGIEQAADGHFETAHNIPLDNAADSVDIPPVVQDSGKMIMWVSALRNLRIFLVSLR